MENILKQFLIDDIIYNVLFDYLLPTEQFDGVIGHLNIIQNIMYEHGPFWKLYFMDNKYLKQLEMNNASRGNLRLFSWVQYFSKKVYKKADEISLHNYVFDFYE